jgi:ribose 5-phosphate isomerase B
MTIYLGADHGGFPLKEKIKTWLDDWEYQFSDLGALQLDAQDDYPDFALAVAKQVAADRAKQQDSFGILLCRSGGGMVIAANKVPGVRAVLVFSVKEAIHAKEHDDANIISLAGDWMDPEIAQASLKAFLETEFSGGERHLRRIKKITDYETSAK